MSLQTYTMCGHPTWSDAACQKCDGCRDGRLRLRGIESASQNVVAKWENEASMLEPALEELRDSLDDAEADNPHYHDSCGSRPADHPAVDDIREALNVSVRLADDLVRIADACRREDGTDIPLGETLRDAAQLIAAQRAALAEIHDFASAAEEDDPMSHVLGVSAIGLRGDLYRPWDVAVTKWKATHADH